MSTDKVLKAIRDVVEAFDELPSHHPARYAHLNINGLRAVLATPPAQAQGVEAVADVPIHPRQGPLWANVRPRGADTPMPSYPMRPLMYADHPSALKRLSPEQLKRLIGDYFADEWARRAADLLLHDHATALAAHNGMSLEP